MQGYSSKKELIDEINKRAVLFINEFSEITDENKDTFVKEVDRSPAQMIAYQLGWMTLIFLWEKKKMMKQLLLLRKITNGIIQVDFINHFIKNMKIIQ